MLKAQFYFKKSHKKLFSVFTFYVSPFADKLADQQTESRKNASKVPVPHDIDDRSDEEDDKEETKRPKPKKARGKST